MKPLILLAIILLATFGAGTCDVLFADVIPLRPYTGIFQTTHLESMLNTAKNTLPLTPLLIVAVSLVLITLAFAFPSLVPSLSILPLGSRGSHSRANRRAGAGWTNKSDKAPVSAKDQFRILMEIFGKPDMVMIYDRRKGEGKHGST